MSNEQKTQVTMTAEELERFEAFKAEEARKAKEARKKEQLKDYRQLVDQELEAAFPLLVELHNSMSVLKRTVFENFQSVIDMKREFFDLSKVSGQFTHTFTSSDSTKRLTIGNRTTDRWDDTVSEGIDIVRDYLNSLATSEETAMLVNTVMKLLSKDKAGNLQAARVIQLMQIAEESGNKRFIEGVTTILKAYRPEPSKFFIKIEVKTDEGSWKTIPLSMTEIE